MEKPTAVENGAFDNEKKSMMVSVTMGDHGQEMLRVCSRQADILKA